VKPLFASLYSALPRVVAILVLANALAACGQKGPLYLPDAKEPKASKSAKPTLPPLRQTDADTSVTPAVATPPNVPPSQ